MTSEVPEQGSEPARSSWTDSPWLTVVFGLAVAMLTWDPAIVTPGPGLDSSWVLGLSMAADLGLDQGTQFVFTYGPLGFLEEPSVAGGLTALLAGLYTLGLRAALAGSLLWTARRSFSLPAAAALAFAVTAVAPRPVVPLVLAAVWCLVALQAEAPAWVARVIVIGGGCFAGVEVLVKLNIGLTVLALVAIAAVALDGRRLRNLGATLGAFLATGAVLWFATGQGLGNVDDFIRSSWQVISGYSEAMQAESGLVGWDRAAAALAALATLAATLYTTRAETTLRRVAAIAVVALVVFALGKQGFVRHDFGHPGLYFGGVAATWLALRWRGTPAVIPAVAVILIALAFFPVTGRQLTDSIQPKVAFDQLRALIDPGRRADLRDFARASMAKAYGVSGEIIDRIGDAPVDVRPWETGLIWAYDLNWRPLPVIQDYQAYTPELDQLNADAAESADGPRFILRHLDLDGTPAAIDNRFASFDAPAETRAILCDFRPVVTAPPYELLERTADRCGEPRPLGNVSAAFGEPVQVPRGRPGEAVFARVDGAAPSGLERIRETLYRAAIRRINLDGVDYRLVPRSAEDGLLLSAPRGADLPQPFTLAPDASTVTVETDGGLATSDGPLQFEFYAVPVR